MAKIKAGPKVALIVLSVVGGLFGLKKAAETGLIPTPGIMKSIVLTKTELPKVADGEATAGVTPIKYASTTAASVPNVLIRGEIWEWNAQLGMFLATGGPCTTHGSLMEKYGVNLCIARQDDTGQMGNDLVSCAKEHASGATQCSTGADFVIIMGDGAGQFIASLNPQLAKLGPTHKLKAIVAVGYSRGEDAFMADPAILRDKNAAKGIVVVCVIRDGDWDIVIKWAADNGIKVNPDEKTYDPDAINFMNSPDYNQAAKDFAAQKSESRKVVKDGHPTGDVKTVTANAVATWTPGDVVAAMQRGGVVKIASSKTYPSQMPSTIIIDNDFAQKNRDEVEGMIAAILQGGDQVKAFDDAKHKAADISAVIYKDQNGKYWYDYYKGVHQRDATGIMVDLGGSYANNLADNETLFGLNTGSNDNFRSTYTIFASYVMAQYPDLFKGTPIPPVKDVEDTSYLIGAKQKMGDNTGAAVADVDYSAAASGPVVSDRSYSIGFDTGKATFTPEGLRTMAMLKDSTAITNLFITVDGYTDNTGNEDSNIQLSKDRANAVKLYLQHSAPKNYPNSRFSVKGNGSSDPVGSNATAEGKAANRRVHIALSGGQ